MSYNATSPTGPVGSTDSQDIAFHENNAYCNGIDWDDVEGRMNSVDGDGSFNEPDSQHEYAESLQGFPQESALDSTSAKFKLPADKDGWISVIVHAINNMVGIVDAPRAEGRKSAHAAELIMDGKFTEPRMKRVAGDLYDAAEIYQQRELPRELLEGCPPPSLEVYDTLDERLLDMVESLRTSKALCKSLLAIPHDLSFMLAPKTAIKKTRRSLASNRTRGKKTKAWRETEGKESNDARSDGQVGSEEDVDPNSKEATKAKKARKPTKRQKPSDDSTERPSKARRLPRKESQPSGPSSASKSLHVPPPLASTMSPAQQAEEQMKKYRIVICHLLGVSPSLASDYSLDDLRLYAQAYMSDQARAWSVPEFPEHRGRGSVFTGPDGAMIHIAELLDRFRKLARSRGDMSEDGEFESDAKYWKKVHPTQKVEYEALGIER